MINSRKLIVAVIATTAFSVAPILLTRAADAPHGEKAHVESWSSIKQVVAVMHPTAGNKVHGVVRFTQEGDSVKVVAHLEGLNPGQKHAMHIHQFGDCSAADATSAGGHYNPEGHPHALPESQTRHAGDLGNVQADDQGNAHVELTVSNISVAGTKNPIVGRSVIVHAKPDDGGQPVGNAGGRVACGVIGVANTAVK